MKKPIKRLAVIHDLCGVGKAALTNIIPILSVMEVEVCPIPTMILSTHTGGFGKPEIVKPKSYLTNAFAHYNAIDINFEGIFIGYLGSEENVNECLGFLKNYNNKESLVVIDPIFGDNGKYYSNFNNDYSERIKEIIKYADVITPNYTEACILANEPILEIVEEEDMKRLGDKISSLGADKIVITSLPLGNGIIGTGIYNKENRSIKIINSQKQDKNYPGTGDIFTSVLCGNLLRDKEVEESAELACTFVEKCMTISSKYDYPAKEGILLEKCLKYL